MLDHWKEHGVPTYMAASAFLGINKSSGKKSSGVQNGGQGGYDSLEELEAMFASSGGVIG